MKLKIIAMMAALFFSANALAAIQITELRPATWTTCRASRIYINHNMATEHEPNRP